MRMMALIRAAVPLSMPMRRIRWRRGTAYAPYFFPLYRLVAQEYALAKSNLFIIVPLGSLGVTMIGKNPVTSWKDSSMPTIDPTCAVAQTASIIGNATIGKHVNVAPGASIRSDEGEFITIGDESNVQDNVVIHCLKGGQVTIGQKVSLAHCAVIHGPATIGDEAFIGFGTVVASSTIGSNAFISHNATVLGVTVGAGKFVAPGTVVQTQEEADALPDVPPAHIGFNDEVIEVNCELAKGNKAL